MANQPPNTSDNTSSSESPHPDFLPHTSTDIILRSCDAIDFHFNKGVLSANCTVFADMFASASPRLGEGSLDDSTNGANIIPVSEDSKSLGLFLRLLTPKYIHAYMISGVDELQGAVSLLTLAEKYDTPGFIPRLIEELLIKLLRSSEEPGSSDAAQTALRIYCIAYRFRLEECVQEAATRTLTLPISTLLLKSHPEMHLASVADLSPLAAYHEACRREFSSLLTEHAFCVNHPQSFVSTYEVELTCKASDPVRAVTPSVGFGPPLASQPLKLFCGAESLLGPKGQTNCRTCLGRTPVHMKIWMYDVLTDCRTLCYDRIDVGILEEFFRGEKFQEILRLASKKCQTCESQTSTRNVIRLQRAVIMSVTAVVRKVKLHVPWKQ